MTFLQVPRVCLILASLIAATPAGAQSSGTDLSRKNLSRVAPSEQIPSKGTAIEEDAVPVGAASSDFKAWQQEFDELVGERLHYPLIGRLQREGGKVGILLEINRTGQIVSATVENSSGNEDLDSVTRQMFEKMTAPPLPASYPSEKVRFVYTINYDWRN